MIGRNKAFTWQIVAFLAVTAACAVGAFVLGGGPAAVAAVVVGVLLTAVFTGVSLARYRQIARLASEIDEVLHSGRTVDFSNCREGDLAVLESELSKLVARLARANAALANEKSALADALADVSHQIRTPLTAASLAVGKLERADDPVVRHRACRELEAHVDRVSWLVTTLLKIAKLDADALTFEAAPTKVSSVVSRAVAPLAASFDLHDVALRVDADRETFVGDEHWTAEAVENIAKNCLEHTPAGGEVCIRVREDAVAMRIVIEDTGPGIAAEDLPHVFERFYRGKRDTEVLGQAGNSVCDDSTPARPEGFGIGLSLAQSIVSAQGGTLRASNRAEGGARFEITFPKLTV